MASIETVILTTPVFKRRVPFSERRSGWNIPYVLPVDCRFECFSPPFSSSPCQNGGTAFQVTNIILTAVSVNKVSWENIVRKLIDISALLCFIQCKKDNNG